MAVDVATLAIKVENGDVVKATTALDGLTVAGGKSEAATQRLTRRMALLEIEARQMDAAMAGSATVSARLASSLGLSEAAVTKLTSAFAAFSAIAVAGLIGRKTLEETEAAQAAMAQLESAVKSTGGTAGRTVQQLDELSVALQKQTTFSDEAVKGAETMLLAFNKIKGDQFDRATKTVTDLAARMGGDLNDAALKVGKALQDPEHGLTQLRRAGIVFSDSQIQVVKTLYETGQAGKGMNLILDEMDKKFGGAAAAARDTLGGALKGLHNAWGDLFELTRGGSNGMVQFINAITHAIERLGPIMDKFARDTVIMFRTMSIDLSKGLFNFLAEREKIIAEANAPAKIAPVGGAGADDEELSKRAQKFREQLAQMDLEIAKQRALNAVIGASSATIALLNNLYDARAARAKNAIEHTAAETAALNKRTNALLAAKDAAVLEAAAQANRKQVTDVQKGNADAIRDAKQALELAGLSDEAAAQRRVDMQAENDLAAARLRFAMQTRDLDKEQADVAAGILQREQDIYASTAKRVEAVRQIGHATATVTAAMDAQKKAADEAQRDMERRARELRRTLASAYEGFITDVLNRKNPFVAIWDNLKRGAVKAISEVLAEKSEGVAGKILGIATPASKQEQAAKLMNEAADKQLRAAGVMNGTPGIVGAGGAQPTAMQKYLQTFLKVGGAAYGGYSAGYGIGSATGSGVVGGAGGAVSGFLLGNAILPGIGGVVGGLAGLAGGIIGAGDAARAAAERMRKAKEAFDSAFEAAKAEVAGDQLAIQIAQVHAQYKQLRDALKDSTPVLQQWIELALGMGPYTATLKDVDALEAKRIAQLKEEAAAIMQQRQDDLDVRTLRNQGRQHEADVLQKQKADAREYAEAVQNHMSDAYLAQLKWNQSVEEAAVAAGKSADAINGLTTAMRNAPSGFKLEPYIQEFAKGAPFPGAIAAPTGFSPPLSPLGNPMLSRTGTVATAPVTINVTVNESKTPELTAQTVKTMFLRELDRTVQSTQGLNGRRGAALEVMS